MTLLSRCQTRLARTPGGNSVVSTDREHTWFGGARRDRTDDLMLAKHALYQLSYGPLWVRYEMAPKDGRPGQTRTVDLTLIRRTL